MNKFFELTDDTSILPDYITRFKNNEVDVVNKDELLFVLNKYSEQEQIPLFSKEQISETYNSNDSDFEIASKKCAQCNNQIDLNANSDFCNCCDLERGAEPKVFAIHKCIYCLEDFEAHSLFQRACSCCAPNLQSLKTRCHHCSKEFIRTKKGQLYCSDSCEQLLPDLPEGKHKVYYSLHEGTCISCNSHFISTYESTLNCMKCAPTGGEPVYNRTVECSVCGHLEKVARAEGSDFSDLCDPCFNISQLSPILLEAYKKE